jgi:D-glycero-D-manno-heptose 1,7-bisphosphate phosphatase
MPGLRRAVFFDRDGTLMEDVHYCGDPALVRVYPGVSEALMRLRAAGWAVFILTNQSGIGRGLITEDQYLEVQAEFLRQTGTVDGSYYCADGPDAPSERRKPAPGMLLDAAREHGIDLAESWMVGDKAVDVECGRRAGTHTIQVLTGYGSQQKGGADLTCRDALEAVEAIIRL